MNKLLAILASFLVAIPAFAAGSTAGGFNPESILLLVVFVAIFYFLLLRPQMKRNKAQRNMMSNLGKGDEIVTNGGMAGTIIKLDDSFISLAIAKGVEIKIQKQAIASILPKGTLK
jgi:preprotein translocase subunit YajC